MKIITIMIMILKNVCFPHLPPLWLRFGLVYSTVTVGLLNAMAKKQKKNKQC